MALASDMMLPPVAASQPRTAATRTAEEPAGDGASSFARVYADEVRQGRTEQPSRPTESSQARAADEPEVAESGKTLPPEDEADGKDDPADAELDPMFMAGLASPFTPVPATPAPALPSGFGAGEGNAANTDGELAQLNQAQGVNLIAGQGAQARLTVRGDESQAGQGVPDMATLLQGLNADQPAATGDGKGGSDAAALSGDLAGLIEATPESKPESRGESFAARLESLTQALHSPQALTHRPVNALVPGQPVAVQQNGWSEALVDRVMWMSSQNLKSAEIQMEPADLGRLEVRIHMAPEQTQVTFASANAGVREALESQTHRLRDMFSQQGLGQLDVNVSDQSQARNWQGQQGEPRRGQGGRGFAGGEEDEAVTRGVAEVRSMPGQQGRGLVDYFA